MTSFPKNPKPHYFEKDEFLTPSNKKVSQKDVAKLIAISKEGRKLEDRLLKINVKNFL